MLLHSCHCARERNLLILIDTDKLLWRLANGWIVTANSLTISMFSDDYHINKGAEKWFGQWNIHQWNGFIEVTIFVAIISSMRLWVKHLTDDNQLLTCPVVEWIKHMARVIVYINILAQLHCTRVHFLAFLMEIFWHLLIRGTNCKLSIGRLTTYRHHYYHYTASSWFGTYEIDWWRRSPLSSICHHWYICWTLVYFPTSNCCLIDPSADKQICLCFHWMRPWFCHEYMKHQEDGYGQRLWGACTSPSQEDAFPTAAAYDVKTFET